MSVAQSLNRDLAGKKNGELLSLAERAGFDAFLTLDRGIEFQTESASSTYRNLGGQRAVQPFGRSSAGSFLTF